MPQKMLLLCLCFLCFLQAQSSRDPFLEKLQHDSFLYFWELANPENGLIPDRAPSPSFSSIAAVGFALSSYITGVERRYITRDQAVERVLLTLKFFWNAPQGPGEKSTGHKGFFYHFLDMKTGLRFEKVELSTIDTALLLSGILSCQVYFDRPAEAENEIRALADAIYRRADWAWFTPRFPLVSMGWHPESGFLPHDWRGYNEGMILYILALGSPTHPLAKESWDEWTRTYSWGKFHGHENVQFSPLFGHQYSHIWIDFKGIVDDYMEQKGIDYFENSRRAVHSNRRYCIENPKGWKGYGETTWGLTACDGPGGGPPFHAYWARGASLLEIADDGTIAPTAAGGSIPFAPEICIPALKAMHQKYGSKIYGKYGFLDAFNPSYPGGDGQGWFDKDYLGIDNGPIVLMIENHYSGLIWTLMKKNEYIVNGLKKAGFRKGWLNMQEREKR